MHKTILLLTAALFLHLGAPKTQAAIEVSVDLFYDQLGDYGDWVEVGDYGYGWQPRDVDEDWRPYSDGRWAYTEAGWTWLSGEPYGWAVYHYGRWARLENRGWVWIPGTEWAPAWVSWRRSPQHVGWAPLPPEASFRRSVGFSGWVDSYYDIGPSAYRFVEVRNFGAPRMRSVFVEPRQNITIINQTTNITRITYVNSVVYNQGPRFEDISRESAEPIRRLKLDRRMEMEGDRSSFRGEQMRSRVDGDSLRVFAPRIDARAVEAPRRLSAKIDKVEVNRGWKDAGPAADVEKLRAKVRGESKAPKGLPPVPKFERLAERTPTSEAKPAEETTKDPSPERSVPQAERSRPPESAPRREAPEPPKDEPRKPKTERPESARQVPPTAERGQPKSERTKAPGATRGNAPEPAARGEAEKTKPGKGKGRDEKKTDSEAKPE